MKLRAPFRYWGAKVRMAPWIVEHLPPHDHYVEACAGSAAVLAVKPPSMAETLNDTYGEVVNFFRVLRDRESAAELIDLVSFTPYSREEFNWALLVDPTSDIDAAYKFLIRMQMAVVPGRTGWSYSTSGATIRKANKMGRWANMPELLRLAAERFERVQVEQLDIIDLIERYDHPRTLFLVDPPYEEESRPTSTGGSSAYEHDSFDHGHFLATLRESGSSFAVTHYPSETYDEAAPWTEVHDYTSHRNVANMAAGAGRTDAVERLYILRRGDV